VIQNKEREKEEVLTRLKGKQEKEICNSIWKLDYKTTDY
jgi:hypothetical protein